MPQTLSDEDVDAIAARTAKCMTDEYKQLWIDRETHYADHAWVADRRSREDEIARFRRKIIQSATIWAVILAAGFVATAVWHAVKAALNG